MSEEFEEAFGDCTAGVVRECKCGRIHFNDVESRMYDSDAELAELRAGAQKDPDRYIPHDGCVSTINVLGSEFVPGCVCGSLDSAEKRIWAHRYAILDYLQRMHAKAEKELERMRIAIKGLAK